MLVIKFGGTSVGSHEALEKVVAILRDARHAGKTSVAVFSAFSKVTDALISAGHAAANGAVHGGAAFEEFLTPLEERHIKCAEHFLSRRENSSELEAATAEIKTSFENLRLLLGSVFVLRELSRRSLDYIMSFGERLSAPLITRIFRASGIDCDFLDSRDMIKTDESFGAAHVLFDETYSRIQKHFSSCGKLQVAPGFIGSTLQGAITTLGRGGSDYSAAIYGAALGAEEIEIWTDVDGFMSADPKLVKNAFTIKALNYNEAMELSHFGAKVLYPPTVQPALDKTIPIRILNTFNTESRGTLIGGKAEEKGNGFLGTKYSDAAVSDKSAATAVKGVSSIGNISLVLVQGTGMFGVAGFSARLFSALSQKHINIILISQASSEYSICFAVMPEDGTRAEAAVKEEFAREIEDDMLDPPIVTEELAVIAVVGANMEKSAGVAGKVFYALGRNGINIIAIAQGSSEINISLVIERRNISKALNSIHEAFFLSGTRSVNLFLVGLGLIGGTLLEQIAAQRGALAEKYKIRVNIAGIANSRRMLFDDDGIAPAQAKTLLESGEPFNLDAFVQRMKTANLPNTAFCDCTANEEVAMLYETILHAAIPVVTPNKKANSGSLDYYKRLTNFSRERGIPYLYEVTVCAGLPVISTLRDLHQAGDVVRRIEGVFSGTLSFIFNSFDGTKPFSALVREAKEKGYTEPDPRDDLNAMDAARKALILARECGMPLEFADVKIEPILPESCFKAKSVDEFFTELEKCDADFEKRRAAAASEGKMLRYAACVQHGTAHLSLRAEAADSPFRSLVDADNIVVITSDRYAKLPMVIKGPGAGAQVTAGAVFADIIRIARTLV
jgi:aspartokinase/homoserine dehydrogenase 1